MANTHTTLTDLFTDIADSIRAKTGSTDSIIADEFPSAITNISTSAELNLEKAQLIYEKKQVEEALQILLEGVETK